MWILNRESLSFEGAEAFCASYGGHLASSLSEGLSHHHHHRHRPHLQMRTPSSGGCSWAEEPACQCGGLELAVVPPSFVRRLQGYYFFGLPVLWKGCWVIIGVSMEDVWLELDIWSWIIIFFRWKWCFNATWLVLWNWRWNYDIFCIQMILVGVGQMEVGGLMRTGKREMEPPELLLVAPSLTPGRYVIVGSVVWSSDLALSESGRLCWRFWWRKGTKSMIIIIKSVYCVHVYYLYMFMIGLWWFLWTRMV